jgi:quercetin dioxygenase-like cupin family protein
MKLFRKSWDGGNGSGVTGLFLVEIKPLFSIVLLRFSKGSREAYHSHAFNALTVWLYGRVLEHMLSGETLTWRGGQVKLTPRDVFHRVEAIETSYALCFRGPWSDTWQESRLGRLITLTHGRKELPL